jgi:hypothetical protein
MREPSPFELAASNHFPFSINPASLGRCHSLSLIGLLPLLRPFRVTFARAFRR